MYLFKDVELVLNLGLKGLKSTDSALISFDNGSDFLEWVGQGTDKEGGEEYKDSFGHIDLRNKYINTNNNSLD